MSKEDIASGGRLLNPYIEIERYSNTSPNDVVHVNATTFEECLSDLRPPFIDNEQTTQRPDERLFAIHGVVGRTVRGPAGSGGYLNIDERPISRTLMGYLTEESLRKNLPSAYRFLTRKF